MNNKTLEYNFKDKTIFLDNERIVISKICETDKGLITYNIELIVDNKKLIPYIQQWLKESENINKAINIKYINECDLWEFNCENKTYVCFGEDLSLLNLDI